MKKLLLVLVGGMPRGTALIALIALSTLSTLGGGAEARAGQYPDPDLAPVFHTLPENVEVLTLENGLEVILMRNPSQPMVGVFTQVRVGSAREDGRTSGMSHMLEHLLFNGSQKYTQEEQYAMADRAGAYNNANTTDFFTNFMMVLPSGALRTGLELQSEMLFHSTLPRDKFLKEKGIVLGELVQARDWPDYETDEALRRALYRGTSLELPTLGTRSTIEHMERDDVYAFYKKWYVPNNMIMTVAGNFDRDRTVAWLEQYYGSIAPGSLEAPPLRPVAYLDATTSITRRVGEERLLALSFDAPTYGCPDFFAFLVMTHLLDLDGGGIIDTALEEIPEERRPDFSWSWEKAPGFGRLTLRFILREESDPRVLYPLVQDALDRAARKGVRGEDILGIVRMSETETLLEREQLRMTGIYIAEPVALGGADFFISYLERLRAVTPKEVSRVMANRLVSAPCLAVLMEKEQGAPAEEQDPAAALGLPEGMDIPPAMLQAMRARGMVPGGDDGTSPEEADAADDAAAPLVLTVDRSELGNGAVLVSQTNQDSPLMAIHLAVRGRALLDRDNAAAGALDLVHRLLSEGYAGCDRACLARRLRELGAVVKLVDDARIPMDNYYTNGRFSFIRVEVASQYGPEMLAMLMDEIGHAAFDEEAFERVREERVGALRKDEASARSLANEKLDQLLYGDHPLVLPPEGDVASLRSLDFSQVRQVYQRAFSPENLIFSIVGPYPHEELRRLIEEELPGRGRPVAGLPALPVTTAGATFRETLGGELSAIRLGSLLAVPREEATALQLLGAILSDRMAMDLRETRGLSYGVGARFSGLGDRQEFVAWINPPTERVDEGLEAIKSFIRDFDAASITQEELDTMRSARKGRMMMRRLSSMGQAYYLAMAELAGDIDIYLDALTAYDGITLEDLRVVDRKYRQAMPLVEVVID